MKCMLCNGDLDTGFRCVKCDWSPNDPEEQQNQQRKGEPLYVVFMREKLHELEKENNELKRKINQHECGKSESV